MATKDPSFFQKAIAGRRAAKIDTAGQHSEEAHPDQYDHADTQLADHGKVRRPGPGGKHRAGFATRPVALLLGTAQAQPPEHLIPVAVLLARFGRSTKAVA